MTSVEHLEALIAQYRETADMMLLPIIGDLMEDVGTGEWWIEYARVNDTGELITHMRCFFRDWVRCVRVLFYSKPQIDTLEDMHYVGVCDDFGNEPLSAEPCPLPVIKTRYLQVFWSRKLAALQPDVSAAILEQFNTWMGDLAKLSH